MGDVCEYAMNRLFLGEEVLVSVNGVRSAATVVEVHESPLVRTAPTCSVTLSALGSAGGMHDPSPLSYCYSVRYAGSGTVVKLPAHLLVYDIDIFSCMTLFTLLHIRC